MTYQQTVDWLFNQIPNYQLQGARAYKPGLDKIQSLLQLSGNPEKKLKFIHVAGTNGKGSVSNMIASVLQEHGFKTGLFTSPHLHDFRERIRINGQVISEKFVTNYVTRFKEDWLTLNPSFFEITTAMAFEAFSENNCEICVIETGLGGRLDSTNVIDPEMAIITTIGLDHTAFLGNTLEAIAGEKAGIIKVNKPVVIGEKNEITAPVFEHIAAERNAPVFYADLKKNWTTDLAGTFQQKNLATVDTALRVLQQSGWNLKDDLIQKGLSRVALNTGFCGRFQIISKQPLVILDAAHNEDGIRVFFEELKQVEFDSLHVVYGASNDKDLKGIFHVFPSKAQYYFSEFDSKRSTKIDEFRTLSEAVSLEAGFYTEPEQAFQAAKQAASPGDVIAVIGSFYLIQSFL